MRIIALLVVLLGLSACVSVSTSPAPSVMKHSEKPPATSPSQVVSDYLEALKEGDFGKTYDFISSGYAANLDKESYELNMKQSLGKYHWALLGYQILGIQMLGDQTFVLTELEMRFQPTNSDKEIQKKIKVQYELAVLENKWKIASDKCIFNCIPPEDFVGQGSNP